VWSDGDSGNGCHPNVSSCTASNDRFIAGDSVVIQNTVEIGSNDNPSRKCPVLLLYIIHTYSIHTMLGSQ
jgi:hypothetical protein